MAHSIDKASFEALEKGWVTTAGILVPGPWFPEVLRWSRSHPNADLGVRLDLTRIGQATAGVPFPACKEDRADRSGRVSVEQPSLRCAAHNPGRSGRRVARPNRHGQARRNPISHLDNHMRAMLVTPALFQSYSIGSSPGSAGRQSNFENSGSISRAVALAL